VVFKRNLLRSSEIEKKALKHPRQHLILELLQVRSDGRRGPWAWPSGPAAPGGVLPEPEEIISFRRHALGSRLPVAKRRPSTGTGQPRLTTVGPAPSKSRFVTVGTAFPFSPCLVICSLSFSLPWLGTRAPHPRSARFLQRRARGEGPCGGTARF